MLSLSAVLALSLSLHLSQGLAASILHRRANACNKLSKSYPYSTIHPGSSIFAEDVIGNDLLSPIHVKAPNAESRLTLDGVEPWSQTCQTTPTCVFAPASADEVAGGLAVLCKANQTFAVKLRSAPLWVKNIEVGELPPSKPT